MRHLKSGRQLGVQPPHRKAMLRNLVTSLIEREQIRTTVARAKELRGELDKMITLGKKGDLSSRRRALAFIKSKEAMKRLFGDFAERYANRDGGFSRIIRVLPRKGDGAEMAIVQLVDAPNDPFSGTKKAEPKTRKKGRKPKAAKAETAKTAVAEDAAMVTDAEIVEEKPAAPEATEPAGDAGEAAEDKASGPDSKKA